MMAAPPDSTALPTIPAIAMQLLDAFSDPDVPISVVVDIIRRDPAITAKLLKAANSPYYGGNNRIDTLDRAVVWLGKHAVVCLALSFSLVDAAQHTGAYGRYYKDLWLTSVVQALSMEWLARRYQPGSQGAAFVAGLLADIGRLALLKNDPPVYASVVDKAHLQRCPLEQVEMDELGKTHSEVSAELLEAWSLPDSIIAVARHHTLQANDVFAREDREDYPQIGAANVAAATADFLTGFNPAESFDRLQTLTARLYGFTDDQIDEYLAAMRERLIETSELLLTDLSQLPSTAELLASAMEQLAHFSLRAADTQRPSDEDSNELQAENEQLRVKINELEKRTSTDPLTRVYNREYFCSRLNQRLQNRTASCLETAVLFVDADNFKSVNDTYGHLGGDEVIKAIAKLTQSALRDTDVVARYGGEEFVVLLDSPDEDHIERIAERICARIAEERIRHADQTISVTVSIGGVFARVAAEQEIAHDFQEQLLDLADKAMYEAKQNGRNQAVIRKLVCQASTDGCSPEQVPQTPPSQTANAVRECSVCS